MAAAWRTPEAIGKASAAPRARQEATAPRPLVAACAIRDQPIGLTALATMAGAASILDAPISNGVAISLILGILLSTVLTAAVIPLLYHSLLERQGRAQESMP